MPIGFFVASLVKPAQKRIAAYRPFSSTVPSPLPAPAFAAQSVDLGAGLAPPGGRTSAPQPQAPAPRGHHARFATLTLASLGVVYGDIGTSPLYALRLALAHVSGGSLPHGEVIGIVSLLLWSLFFVVTLKYVFLFLRISNQGEGGTLSLLAKADRAAMTSSVLVLSLAMAGASLFYGDAIITPAISVLSAIEGLGTVAPELDRCVLPVTVVILFALFLVQSRGTEAVAKWFGPVMVLWFLALAALGILHIGDSAEMFAALNPLKGIFFLLRHGVLGLIVLGAVFLAVTGAEALYADMGHFGIGPIRVTWMCLALPALALNYLGQGAYAIAHPEAVPNLFFLMAPDFARVPLIVLATVATVIAAQSVITGAFSLTRQAAHLGLLPRFEIRHTSEDLSGQIYLPRLNFLLLIGVLLLVMMFKSSSALANSYGVAVSGSMLVDTLLAYVVLRRVWKWSPPAALATLGFFAAAECVFIAANFFKIAEGAFIPLILAAAVFILMWSWVRGTKAVFNRMHRDSVLLKDFIPMMETSSVKRIEGMAVFLTADPEVTPDALLHNIKHNHVLHKKNLILRVITARTPTVADSDRFEMTPFNDSFVRVDLTFGYMESPNVPKALLLCRKSGLKFDIMTTSFFLNRRIIRPGPKPTMPRWQEAIFIHLTEEAATPTDFYRLPAGRVVELGQQVTI